MATMYKPTSRNETGQPIQRDISDVSYLGPRYLRQHRRRLEGGARVYEDDENFVDTTLSSKLGSLSTGSLVLLPPDISGISIGGLENPQVTLREVAHLDAGRKHNRSGVKFGQLHISDDTANPVAELVAAKYIHRLTAPRELNAALSINHRFGEDVAFTPIGFIKGEDGKVGYLSRYEHSVITLDNTLWNKTATPAQREEAMGFAGLWLASLHNHGVIHGDAQAKNIARDSSNKPRYVDLEGAHDIHHGKLDSYTTRLLDIRDVFNPMYMKSTSPDEEAVFIDSYAEHQSAKRKIDTEDILDTIRSAQESEIEDLPLKS